MTIINKSNIKAAPVRGHSFFVYLQSLLLVVALAVYSGAAMAEMININTADAAALQTLPGIGKKKAADIVAYREQNGNFKQVDDLINVTGIGQKMLNKIKPHVTVEGGISKATDTEKAKTVQSKLSAEQKQQAG